MDSLSRSGADSVGAYEAAAARPKTVVALSVLALALLLLAGIMLRNGGHFTYTLDAPYTQMAMAEQITQGTYGINPGEPASPSSSIIYPFLLAVLSFLPLGQFSALLVCLAATLAAAVLMYAVAEEIGLEVDRLTTLQLVAITATLTLAFNLAGLAFAGLEHSLHVTLTVASLLGLLRFVRTKQADWWWLAAITLLPLLRFEAAAALAADMLVLVAFGKWRHAAMVGAVGVVLVGGFMAFLHLLGLPWLPSSVLHRSEVASTGIGMGQGGALGFVKAIYGAYRGNLMAYGGTHIALLIVLGLWGLARGPVPSRFGSGSGPSRLRSASSSWWRWRSSPAAASAPSRATRSMSWLLASAPCWSPGSRRSTPRCAGSMHAAAPASAWPCCSCFPAMSSAPSMRWRRPGTCTTSSTRCTASSTTIGADPSPPTISAM